MLARLIKPVYNTNKLILNKVCEYKNEKKCLEICKT